MATFAGRRLHDMLDNAAHIVAIELLAAVQGIEFHAPQKTSATLQQVQQQVRELSDPYAEDRSLSADVERVAAAINGGGFTAYAVSLLPSRQP
jgi:histidine ammonia-lyase